MPSGAGVAWEGIVFELNPARDERVHRRPYPTRAVAHTDVFDYIEGFYDRQRAHSL